MKFCRLIFLLLLSSNVFAQHKIDSLLGSKGIFRKLLPQKMAADGKFSFDLKMTVMITAKGGSKSQSTPQIYANTKDGYVGIDKSAPAATTVNPAKPGLDFLIETLSQQSFRYTNSTAGGKQFEELSTRLVNTFNNVSIKKSVAPNASPRKYLSNSLTATPYYLDVMGLQKKIVRYLYGPSPPATGQYTSYLGSFGVGFYNIDGNSFLCVATENNQLKIEITKVEKVNLLFNAAGFITK